MNDYTSIYSTDETKLYGDILDFVEDICQQYDQESNHEGTHEALFLNLIKVTNDCRAILLLTQSEFLIQAGIIARSTTDACNLMMHIDVERDNAIFAERWLEGRRVTHWMLIERLKGIPLDIDKYRELRKLLDNLVHANYEGLKLYPLQLAGSESWDATAFDSLTFWKHLMIFYMITCLFAVQMLAPERADHVDDCLDLLLRQIYGQMPQDFPNVSKPTP
jgi:hypothetical protein